MNKFRDPAIEPQDGDIIGYRDTPKREVVKRFTDACGRECIIYQTEHVTTLTQWKIWSKGLRQRQ